MKNKAIFRFCHWLLYSLSVFLLVSSIVFGQKAQSFPPGTELDDDGVPVLIKHLPDWEQVQKRAALTSSLPELQKLVGNHSVLSGVDFVGGTEAVTADYGQARLLIVEFPTPQLAIEVDQKIQARLTETQPPATAVIYRKIGNYAVFVFDAPDEATANTLLGKVNYEKTVQWLGDNPYPAIIAQRKEREYLMTTGDIFVTVIKSSGLAILAALGLGGLCGATVFYMRRRQQNEFETFSDAGGMLRLNLDDLTASSNKLLEDGKSK